MIMRMRRPNRRSFKSPIRERRKRQREYYYASVSILVVKIVVFVFLGILFSVSLRLFHYRFTNMNPLLRYAVPTLVAIFAIVLAYFIYLNIKEIIELSKEKH